MALSSCAEVGAGERGLRPSPSRTAWSPARRCRCGGRPGGRPPARATCSLGEPIIVPLCVRTSDGCMRAMPKSMIFACPPGQQHDVAGLDVAVDDAARVRGGQGRGDLRGDVAAPRPAAIGPAARRSRSSVPCSSSIAMYSQSPFAPEVVDGDDAGVVQAAGRLGLLAKARLQVLRRSCAFRPGSSSVLIGDLALQRLVLGQVDHAHGAAPELAQHAVAAQVGERWRCSGGR